MNILDKTIIVWNLDENGCSGKPVKSLHGHGHFVSDVVMSSDGQYALSGSWDKTLRLWDLNTYDIFLNCILLKLRMYLNQHVILYLYKILFKFN